MIFTDNTNHVLSLQSLQEFLPLDPGTRAKTSIPDVATSSNDGEIAPIWHGVDKSIKKGLWDLVPLTLDLPSQSHSIVRAVGLLVDAAFQEGPQVFDWIQVCTQSRPVHHLHIVLLKEGLCDLCSVGRGVVMLENIAAASCKEGHYDRAQDLCYVAKGSDSTATTWLQIEEHWPNEPVATHCPPHHDGLAAPQVVLLHVLTSKALATRTIDVNTPVNLIQTEANFVAEHDSPPVCVPVPVNPIQPGSTMLWRQIGAMVGSAAVQLVASEKLQDDAGANYSVSWSTNLSSH